jgi:pyruvate/2-oxoglutarate dehydrogenase complex dihydrolipoamide dehydrogenase (E3) component
VQDAIVDKGDQVDVLVLGSGEAGKYVGWTMAKAGLRTAVVEREFVGGVCPNVACPPSKNVTHSAKVAQLSRLSAEFGLSPGLGAVDMAGVRERKRKMVEELVTMHLSRYRDCGAELILGEGRFVAPKTIEVALKEGGARLLAGDRVFLNLGTRASVPDLPGCAR